MEAYKHSQQELEILRLLARGEKEIEAGKGYDLDAVLAEADSLLRHYPKIHVSISLIKNYPSKKPRN
jgi:hypothetical protein